MVSTFSLLPTGTERHILVLCDPHCRRLGIAKLNSTSLEIYVTLCFTGWPESDIMTDRRPLSVAFLLRIFALVPYTACSMGFRPTIVGTSIQLPPFLVTPSMDSSMPTQQTGVVRGPTRFSLVQFPQGCHASKCFCQKTWPKLRKPGQIKKAEKY